MVFNLEQHKSQEPGPCSLTTSPRKHKPSQAQSSHLTPIPIPHSTILSVSYIYRNASAGKLAYRTQPNVSVDPISLPNQ